MRINLGIFAASGGAIVVPSEPAFTLANLAGIYDDATGQGRFYTYNSNGTWVVNNPSGGYGNWSILDPVLKKVRLSWVNPAYGHRDFNVTVESNKWVWTSYAPDAPPAHTQTSRSDVASPPVAGPLAWSFDRTFAEDAGGLLIGPINGSSLVRGYRDHAINFNRLGSQYGVVPITDMAGYSDMTVAAWVYTNGGVLADQWQRVVDINTSQSNYFFLTTQSFQDSKPRVGFRVQGASEQSLASSVSFPVGQWAHLAFTKSGNTGRLYLNGVEVGVNTSMTQNLALLGSGVNFWTGRSAFADPYFDGRIDELKVYKRALSASEVSALATEASTLPVGNYLAREASRSPNQSDLAPLIHNAAGVGSLLSYNASDPNPVFAPSYGLTRLNNGDIGGAAGTDYCVFNAANGTLSLDLGSVQPVGSIAIYGGYKERDNGTFTIKDWADNVLFTYTHNPKPGGLKLGGRIAGLFFRFLFPHRESKFNTLESKQTLQQSRSGRFRFLGPSKSQRPERVLIRPLR